MLYHSLILASVALSATAYPFALDEQAAKRQVPSVAVQVAQAQSRARTNCGNIPCLTFNEKDQFVSISGEHVYRKPSADQIRGSPQPDSPRRHQYTPLTLLLQGRAPV